MRISKIQTQLAADTMPPRLHVLLGALACLHIRASSACKTIGHASIDWQRFLLDYYRSGPLLVESAASAQAAQFKDDKAGIWANREEKFRMGNDSLFDWTGAHDRAGLYYLNRLADDMSENQNRLLLQEVGGKSIFSSTLICLIRFHRHTLFVDFTSVPPLFTQLFESRAAKAAQKCIGAFRPTSRKAPKPKKSIIVGSTTTGLTFRRHGESIVTALHGDMAVLLYAPTQIPPREYLSTIRMEDFVTKVQQVC